jgi:hypothetical protein
MKSAVKNQTAMTNHRLTGNPLAQKVGKAKKGAAVKTDEQNDAPVARCWNPGIARIGANKQEFRPAPEPNLSQPVINEQLRQASCMISHSFSSTCQDVYERQTV